MRDRMERFVILPFGCISESSVAVAVQQQQQQAPPSRRSKPAADTNSTATKTREQDEEESLSSDMKYSLKLLPLPKPDITTGFHRLFKGFKNISQLFAYKEEMEETEEDDMEIGHPTDVKHVTHIGLDGSASSCSSIGGGSWDNFLSHDLFSFPSVPTLGRQCELPMETLAPTPASPLVHAST